MTTPATPGAVKPKKGHELRPVESAPSFGDLTDDPIAALRRLAVFRGLTERELTSIASASSVVRFPQDVVVPRGGEGSEAEVYYFVIKGQVAFAEFAQGTVPKGPVNPKKRPTPLMQVAERNVALFEPNDFFANDHVAEARGADGVKREMALYTCLPVVLLELPREALDEILAAVPQVKGQGRAARRGVVLSADLPEGGWPQRRPRLLHQAGLRVRHRHQGHPVGQVYRLRLLHPGLRRPPRHRAYRALRPQAGHHAVHPELPHLRGRALPGSLQLRRDRHRSQAAGGGGLRQLRGLYAVRQGLPARGHPHGRRHRARDRRRAAGEGQERRQGPPGTVVAEGEDKKAKKKKPKRIANKCDHCLGYSDLACISACPTGAIIQIDPRALFRRDGGLIERAEKYFDPKPFERGYADTWAARA
jgi:ferredoxin